MTMAMTFCLITGFLLALAFNEVTSNIYVSHISKAIKAKLNSTCVEQYGTTVPEAADYMKTCIDEIFNWNSAQPEPQHIRDVVCNGDKLGECVKKYEQEILISCLPKHLLGVTKQSIEVFNQFIEIECGITDDNYFVTCGGEYFDVVRAKDECVTNFGSSKPFDLKDIFSTNNCKEYKNLYECLNAISFDCPGKKKEYTDEIRLFAEASLCNEAS